MRQAIGFLIILWGLSHYFGEALAGLEDAATATFKTVEVAATASQQRIAEI